MTEQAPAMELMNGPSCFDRVHDVAVIGAGYAGYAAAQSLQASGCSVLLIDRGGDLLWESGRAFAFEPGSVEHPLWQELMRSIRQRGGTDGAFLDGAIAEVVATHHVVTNSLLVLYYASPAWAESEGDRLVAVRVATKSGPRRVAARHWIDATETGQLLALHPTPPARRRPLRQWLHLFLQHHAWPGTLPASVPSPSQWPDAALTLHGSLWPGERVMRIDLPGEHDCPRQAIEPSLRALRATLDPLLGDTVLVDRVGTVAVGVYTRSNVPQTASCWANVTHASPAMTGDAVTTPADRFALGLDAASRVQARLTTTAHRDRDTGPGGASVDATHRVADMTADVIVVGGGTGGAVAAIAAARAGVRVICLDAQPFPGGIGTGGAIHHYYFGLPGGMQAELDRRVRQVMDAFGPVRLIRGFHPEARKLVLDQMMHEAGVTFLPRSMLVDVDVRDGRIHAIDVSRPDGLYRLHGRAWIDGTGDGDLCALAGAGFEMGRVGDGLLHAYSQSAGCLRQEDRDDPQRISMRYTNFDAGWVDPTDPQDLTRGRLMGICHYLRNRYDNLTRPTYIAAAIGVRQGRNIKTRATLTLADLIERRRFAEVIGFTGSLYDNHAIDYEFESDEAMFWAWHCRQRRERVACEMPYGMLVPQTLDNVWIASRAHGASIDAQYVCRMQRDIQRIGEAAGCAAALAVQHDVSAEQVPIGLLQRMLAATGAIDRERTREGQVFGTVAQPEDLAVAADDQAIAQGLENLARGIPHATLWRLYRHPRRVRVAVHRALASDDARVSWLAAGVVAMWGDAQAEPRLFRAIHEREYGYPLAPDTATVEARHKASYATPQRNPYLVPNWFAAISLLRRCGTDRALFVLLDLAEQDDLILNVRTSIALTVERLLLAGRISASADIERLIDRLRAQPVAGSIGPPKRYLGPMLEQRRWMNPGQLEPGRVQVITAPEECHLWQLHLVICRLARLIDVPLPEYAATYTRDPRASVRRAFAACSDAVTRHADAAIRP